MNKGADKIQYTSKLEDISPLIVWFYLNVSRWEVCPGFSLRDDLAELQILIRCEKNAWWLDTSVYDFALMEVSKALKQLCRYLEHFVLGDTFLLLSLHLNLVVQVATFTQLHHDAHLRLRSAPLFDDEVIFYLDDVWVVNRFHQPYFSLIDFLIHFIDDLAWLKRENFAILDSCDFPDQAEARSVQLLAKLVLLFQIATF